jgi:hypothetical protein
MYTNSSYTVSKLTGTQLLNAITLVQSQPYCCKPWLLNVTQALGMEERARWKKDQAGMLPRIGSDSRITHITLWETTSDDQ